MINPYTYQDHLETERLFTRFLTVEDTFLWMDFFKDKEAIAFIPNFGAITIEDRAKQWIDRQLTRYRENRFGLQALIEKNSKAFIGQCGLLLQEVDGITETEVGYHVFKKHWGRGYAPEAAKRFIDYAFTHQLTDSVISIIDIRNTNSQRVADKNGLKREKQTRWNDMDVYIYRMSKAAWENALVNTGR